MNPKIRQHTVRAAVTIGFAAGAWGLAATSPGAQTDLAAMVAAADIAAGQAASLQCAGCHTFGEGEPARFGPNLFGIVDRPVAGAEGFGYSAAMTAVGAAGGTWTIELLNDFLASPQTAIPGTTMPFAGIEDATTRANLIGYLATLGGDAAAGGVAAAAVGTPVSYSTEQAVRGERRYTRDCAECHGDTLNGGLIGGPPLRGLAFEAKYLNGAPASALFAFTSTAMPPDDPGRLQASIYADLIAYILQENGFVAGAELPDDLETLNTLIMVK